MTNEEHDMLHDWFFGSMSGKQIREYAATHGNGITMNDVVNFVNKDKETHGMNICSILSFLDANGIWVI